MRLKNRQLFYSGLYVILDKGILGTFENIIRVLRLIKKVKPGIIQYRNKDGLPYDMLKDCLLIKRLAHAQKAFFIVNDYPEIAVITDADGLHLGQDDISISVARKILSPDKLIGKSCHSLKQALSAQKEGADYLGIGPIFSTPTKPEYQPVGLGLINKVKEKINLPIFAIGGINADNVKLVMDAGATGVAVCRASYQNTTLKKLSQVLGKG